MPEAVIIDAVRTPIGNFRGGLAKVRPDDLAAIVLKALIERPDLSEKELVKVIGKGAKRTRTIVGQLVREGFLVRKGASLSISPRS